MGRNPRSRYRNQRSRWSEIPTELLRRTERADLIKAAGMHWRLPISKPYTCVQTVEHHQKGLAKGVGSIHEGSGCAASSQRQTAGARPWHWARVRAAQSATPARPTAPPDSSRRGIRACASAWSCARICSRPGSFVSWRQCRAYRANGEVVQTFLSLTVSQEKSCSWPAAAGALPETSDQLVAQPMAQRGDRRRHVALRAQDSRGGCNPREGQAPGVR